MSLRQLLDRDAELLADVGGEQLPLVAGRADQHPGQRDQPGEALGADHGLGLAVGAAAALGVGDRRGTDRLGGLEVAGVAAAEHLAALLGLPRQLRGLDDAGVLPPAEQPGDELPGGGELGGEDGALAELGVAVGGGLDLAVLAVVALDQPVDAVAQEDPRRARLRAHLPVRPRRVVAAIEASGRVEVVLGLARVGDLALDPREPEDPDGIPFVRVTDQVELAGAEDEVVRIDLAIHGRVPLHRVVAELDRLAARDRGLDLGEALGELPASRRGRHRHLDRGLLAVAERALAAPRDLLKGQPQGLGVGELAVEQRQRGAQGGELAVGELDGRQVVVLGRKRVQLGLEESLTRLVDLEGDAEALELGPVGVEAARERILVHRRVALDLLLDLERRNGAAVRHQERDQRELAD